MIMLMMSMMKVMTKKIYWNSILESWTNLISEYSKILKIQVSQNVQSILQKKIQNWLKGNLH